VIILDHGVHLVLDLESRGSVDNEEVDVDHAIVASIRHAHLTQVLLELRVTTRSLKTASILGGLSDGGSLVGRLRVLVEGELVGI
jgi:hypothetical protein